MNFAIILAIILISTTLAGHLSVRLGQPAVIGQMLAGIILGPTVLNLVPLTHTISIFADVGVIVLMFLAGLETDTASIRRYLRPSILVASLGIIVPLATTYLLARAWQLPVATSLFTGIVFAATSVSISVAVLRELGVLSGRAGSIILGAAVLDDVIAVLMLGLFMSLSGTKSGGLSMGGQLLLQAAFMVLVWFVIKLVAPLLMRLAGKLLVPFGRELTALGICLLMAGTAEIVGLSSALGAFFAGIAVSQTSVRQEIGQAVDAIGTGIFVPVFFVSIGLHLHLDSHTHWVFVALLTLIAVAGKWLGAGLGARMTGSSLPEASVIGAGMISRGEMALIVALTGERAGLISGAEYNAVIAAVILATIIAPVILRTQVRRQQNAPHN